MKQWFVEDLKTIFCMRDPDKLFKGLNYLAESLWRIFHSYGFATSLRAEIVLLLVLQKEWSVCEFLKLEPEAKDKSEPLWRQSPTFKNRVKYKDSFKPAHNVFEFVN